MRTLVFLFLLLAGVKGEEQEVGIDINPNDDVHLIYINNYTNVLHIKMKWVTFVFKDNLVTDEGFAFHNYSRVAKELKGKNFFTKLNATIMPHVAEDFLTSVPGIIFFVNKTAYVYNGSYVYEEILLRAEQVSSPDWVPDPNPLIELTDSNFDTVFTSVEFGVFILLGHEDETRDMMYYGRVKTLSEKLEKDGIPVLFVNNKTDPDVARRLDVHTLGSLHLVRHAKLYGFRQQMQDHISSMVKYVKVHKKFGSKLITDYKLGLYQIGQHEKEDLGIFVAVFSSNVSSWFSVFQESVYTMRDDFRFFHTFDREVGRLFGCNQLNCLLTFYPKRLASPYDSEVLQRNQLSPTELRNFETVRKYILLTSRPLVGHLSNYVNVLNVYRNLFPKAVLYMDVDFDSYVYEENKYYIKKLWKLAIEFPNISFVFSDREDHESSLKERNLLDTGNEVDFVIEGGEDYYYVMKEEFSEETAKIFIQKYLSKQARPALKSAPLPEVEFDQFGIRTLVAKNFDEVVFKENKDMIILFYVGWCDHCRKFFPIFDEVASVFKGYDRLSFAKFDCVKNVPPPEYPAKAYPTIYFAPLNDKMHPIKYEKRPNDGVPDLLGFIETHLTKPLEKKTINVGDL